jgi:hypothetical protein
MEKLTRIAPYPTTGIEMKNIENALVSDTRTARDMLGGAK